MVNTDTDARRAFTLIEMLVTFGIIGRLGGLKGGKARAAALSAKKLKEITQKAAMSRWSKDPLKPVDFIPIWNSIVRLYVAD